MNNLVNQVNDILKREGKLSSDFGACSKIYLHTTENIKGFLQGYCLRDKSILTVAGSGDQVLNSYLMGAKNVTCFDINPLTLLQVKLKMAAVSTLTFSEYCAYFFRNTDKNSDLFFNHNLFNKISINLDNDTFTFFNYLYSNYSVADFFEKVYYRYSTNFDNMQRMNAYLDPMNYEKLSKILKDKDIDFINSNITDLKSKITDLSFDMILLSNISESIGNIFPEDALKNYKRLIHSLSKSLTTDGIIQAGYIYDYYSGKNRDIFSNKKERQKIFSSDEFHTSFVESYRFHSESDAVITFQKLNRKKH